MRGVEIKSKPLLAGGVMLLSGVLIFCVNGSTPSDHVEVSGTVYLDGQPLADADVFFVDDDPSDGGSNGTHRAHGRTDAEGRYELVRGAVPGDYKVIVRALLGGQANALAPGFGSDGVDAGQLAAASAAADTGRQSSHRSNQRRSGELPQQLPDSFSSAEHTVLTVGVPESGTNDANLRLSLNRIAVAH